MCGGGGGKRGSESVDIHSPPTHRYPTAIHPYVLLEGDGMHVLVAVAGGEDELVTTGIR